MTTRPSRPLPTWTVAASLGILLAALAAHAATGSWARYVADDYCTAATLRTAGFWAGQAAWYGGWSGRYAYYFTVQTVELLGPAAAAWVPPLVLLAWLASLTWALEPPIRQRAWPRPWLMAGLSAAAIVAAVLAVLPDVYQSVYWLTGTVTYSWPMALLALQVGLLLRDAEPRASWLSTALIGLLAWWTAGFNEVLLGVQSAVYAVALLASWRDHAGWSSSRVKLAAFGLLGTFLGGAMTLLAPGNQHRLVLMPSPPELPALVSTSLRYAAGFVWRSVTGAPLAILSLAAMAIGLGGIAVAEGRWKPGWSRVGMFLMAGGIALWAAMMPSAYATSAYLPDRALVAPAFVLVVAAGLIAVNLAPGRTLGSLVLVGCLALSVQAASGAFAIWRDAREYASMWERRQAAVLEAKAIGQTDVTVHPLPHIGGLAELVDDPDEWVNVCFASYHDLKSVIAR